MRLEVLVGNEEPIIYPLNSSKIILGNSEQCDVVISADGVSRRHLHILVEDDRFYVIDQGSTNGTYINEERLVPGKKAEFTSFFPVRLGDSVLISLLSEEETLDSFLKSPNVREKTSPGFRPSKLSEASDATSVISINTLKKSSTEKLVLERNVKRTARKKSLPSPPPPKKDWSKQFIPILSAMIVVGAFAYKFYFQSEDHKPEEVLVVGQNIEDKTPIVAVSEPDYLIPKTDYAEKKTVEGYLNSIKCTTDLEVYLCNLIFGNQNAQSMFGVVQVGLKAFVILEADGYFQQAAEYIKPSVNASAESEKYVTDQNKVVSFLFLKNGLPKMDEEKTKDIIIHVAFFRKTGAQHILSHMTSFLPHIFNKEKDLILIDDRVIQLKRNGASALSILDPYFAIY